MSQSEYFELGVRFMRRLENYHLGMAETLGATARTMRQIRNMTAWNTSLEIFKTVLNIAILILVIFIFLTEAVK